VNGRLLLKGGRVVDPARGIDAKLDVLLEDGLVSEVGSRARARGAEVVDVSGLVVCLHRPAHPSARARK
jgi:dihydroorotase